MTTIAVQPVADAAPAYNRRYVWLICLVAAMGGLLFGYDWVVIGGAKPFYEPYFAIHDRPFQQGFAMSSALFGCILGAVVAGAASDRFGRRLLLIVSGLLFTLSAVWTGLADGLTSFNLARFVGGVGIGIASSLSPMYIAEISPAAVRGRFVSINQLTIVIGILAAQVVNLVIARDVADATTVEAIRESWNGRVGWRWMFASEALPAAAFFGLMFFIPESPRWLMKQRRDAEAQRVLAAVGGEGYARDAAAEIRSTLREQELERVRFADLLEPRLMKVLGLGVFLAVLQQWCGINVIFNYAQEVFHAAGYDVGDLMFTIVITGIVNLVFTVLAIFTVDRVGRRSLMLIGAAGLAGIYAVLGMGFYLQSAGVHMLLLVVLAIASYATTLAPITWVVIAEIFPNRIRGAAMAVAVLALWVACTALTFSFPILHHALGSYGAFWLYGAICAVGFVVMHRALPETKGKTLEEIERQLVDTDHVSLSQSAARRDWSRS